MKRIIVSLDGTWQTGEQNNPTNIKLIHDCITPFDQNGIPQLAKHFDGGGTQGHKLKRVFTGVTGDDLEDRIKEAYKYIVENYEDGDEIVFSGFSRGAYTARTLNAMIYNSGIIDPSQVADIDQAIDDAYDLYQSYHRPNDKTAIEFRQNYAHTTRPKTILACFDTVGAFGVPAQLKSLANIFNRDHIFHDTQVNRNTTHAFHLAAIDEQRKNFPLTPMHASDKANTKIMQLWCVGNHSAVGGGSNYNKHKPLSDIAGLKMIDLLQHHCGLGFDAEKMKENFQPNIHINPRSDFKQSGAMWKLFGINTRRIINLGEQFDETVGIRWKHNHLYRPTELNKFSDQDNNFPLCRLPKP